MKNKSLGSFLILAGTAIGAGMLALPMVSDKLGFSKAACLLIGIWLLMTYTGFLILKVNLSISGDNHNFDSMAKHTLGKWGQGLTWICVLFLLYALSWAYIAGNGSLISGLFKQYTHFNLPAQISEIVFTLIFGGAVYWSTRAVDGLNRGLMSIKGLLVILTVALLLPKINWTQLIQSHIQTHSHFSAICIAAPIFLTAFGYHTVIPSIRSYVGPDSKKIKKIILWGTVIPLIIYLLWMGCALGIIPQTGHNSFATLPNHSVGAFIGQLNSWVHNHWVKATINGFSNIAMTTSFLGVTLGLFDFIADALKRSNCRIGRLQTAGITFIPPLILAICAPHGFIFALGYAAIFVAILEVILPVLMVFSLNQKNQSRSIFQKSLGIVVLICGLFLIISALYF